MHHPESLARSALLQIRFRSRVRGNSYCIALVTYPQEDVNADGPLLPAARGPMSEQLLGALVASPRDIAPLPRADAWVLGDEDAMLSLYVLYELHYRGYEGVDQRWEWEPSLLRERARIESAFERDLRALVGRTSADARRIPELLCDLAGRSGPSLSGWFETEGTLTAMREFAIHRSLYQRKEADPHTFAIPRIGGRAKAALVEIQFDEYGSGEFEAMHSELFADTMRALDLDPTYGAYIDAVPAVTLATTNLVSMFGLHRRWRGALIGHLALFEMCSVVPMGRYARALHRLGVPDAAPFYDAHVVADARHEVIACHAMAGELARAEPQLAADIMFGAHALHELEARLTRHLLHAWETGRSSLRSC
jgi:hypothetical protein